MTEFMIGIPTYRRPHELARLLSELSRQVPVETPVLVVDNDPAFSAREVVSTMPDLSLRYLQEATPGVSAVRTRLMREAADTGASLIFLDDDQLPEPGWYDSLRRAHARDPMAILAGPVNYILPDDSPRWARSGYFARPKHQDGAQLEATGFGNCLIPSGVLALPGLNSVDGRFARSGGEDTEYTWRARRAGVEILWCSTAGVQETVPVERVTLAAVRRRYVRNGEVLARLRLREYSRIRVALAGMARIVSGSVALAYATGTRQTALHAPLARICGGWGGVRAALGLVSSVYGED